MPTSPRDAAGAPPGTPPGRSPSARATHAASLPPSRWPTVLLIALAVHALALLPLARLLIVDDHDEPLPDMEVISIVDDTPDDSTAVLDPVEEPMDVHEPPGPLAALDVESASEEVHAEEELAMEESREDPEEEDAPEEHEEAPQAAEQERLERQSVHQPDRGTEAPDEADYLAEVDNIALEETLAEETTDVRSGDDQQLESLADEPQEELAAAEEVPSEDLPDQAEADDAEELAAEEGGGEEEAAALDEQHDEAVEEELATADDEPEEVSAQEEVVSIEQLSPEEGAEARPEEAAASEHGAGLEVGERVVEEQELQVVREHAEEGLSPEEMVDMLGNRDHIAELPDPGVRSVARDVVMFSPDSYAEVFADRDAAEREAVERGERERGFLGDHEAEWEALRHALANHDVRARAGTETSLNTRADAFAGYIHYLHDKIHAQWPPYVRSLDFSVPEGHPLSDPRLMVQLEYVIAANGQVVEVNVVRPSGVLPYDARAIRMLQTLGPHRAPPSAMVSPDGNAYIHWRFHRDQRQCGTFGVDIRVLADEEASLREP